MTKIRTYNLIPPSEDGTVKMIEAPHEEETRPEPVKKETHLTKLLKKSKRKERKG